MKLPQYNEIPYGPYCYSDSETCPYWRAIEYDTGWNDGVVLRARCDLKNEEDDYPQSSKLIWDKVKFCGINE